MTKVTNLAMQYLQVVTKEGSMEISTNIPGNVFYIADTDSDDTISLYKSDLDKLIKLLQEFQHKLEDLETQ